MIRKIGLIAAATAFLSLAACNTVNGAGKDLKSAGTAISTASGETKK
ncbi:MULTISPECIES: entericidin A/B family lipoprotein [unclassified Sphingomonas]|jgi:entericidin B|nr:MULTISPECIES: entericidin A/B family lipoprotein [unclassified Sphingomonas]AXJ96221.1 hypothetical protein DM480_12670 [Sphingomonas sp. FARSPH]